jgi:hypothetical protein
MKMGNENKGLGDVMETIGGLEENSVVDPSSASRDRLTQLCEKKRDVRRHVCMILWSLST